MEMYERKMKKHKRIDDVKNMQMVLIPIMMK